MISEIKSAKVSKAYADIIKLLQKNKLTTAELLLTLGNVLYSVGASIGGYKEKGPGPAELEKIIATEPNLPAALMAAGLHITTWVDDLGKTVEDIKNDK